MKKKIQKILIRWFFRKPIRKYVLSSIKDKDADMVGYIYDLLCKDETKMVGSREGLQGYYDLDIEINRELQKQIKEYAGDKVKYL